MIWFAVVDAVLVAAWAWTVHRVVTKGDVW